jgi:hypothetical protein
MIYFDSDMSRSINAVVYFNWKTVIYIYVCRKCRTQYMLKMEKSVTFTGACANEIIPSINRSFVYKAKEERHVRIIRNYNVQFIYTITTQTLVLSDNISMCSLFITKMGLWMNNFTVNDKMVNNQHGRHLCYTTIPSRYLRRIIMIKYWSINLTTNFNCRSHLNIRLLINGIYCLEITISNKIKCIDSLNLYDISTLSLFMTAL